MAASGGNINSKVQWHLNRKAINNHQHIEKRLKLVKNVRQ